MNEILKNIFVGLAKANCPHSCGIASKKYFLKYRQINPSLWASYTFVYATLFRFILALASISTHSLAYTKVYKSYEHTNF